MGLYILSSETSPGDQSSPYTDRVRDSKQRLKGLCSHHTRGLCVC